jgi:hypothetical protein
MLIPAPETCTVIVGIDRQGETSLHVGNAGDLPAADDFVRDGVHVASELLAPANRQLIHVVQSERLRDIRSVD